MRIKKMYPRLSKKLTKKEILLVHSAMKGEKVDAVKLEIIGKMLDYSDGYEIFTNAPRCKFTYEKMLQIEELEKEYGTIERLLDEKMTEIDDSYKRVVDNENKLISVVCPFCKQNLIITGDYSAECKFCGFSVGVSTVSDQQDEYILYINNWFKKSLVVIRQITKEELYKGRYLKSSNLIDVLKDERVIKIANIWRNGLQ